MSIKQRLDKIEQATKPKPAPRPLEVHALTHTEAGWSYDNQPITDEQAVSIARRKTHRNHFVIIRDHQADQAIAVLADISLARSYI